MRRLNRARKKAIVSPEEPGEPTEEPEEPTDEPDEDPEVIRKRAIADKRRESLALAGSKIKPKSQITKEKDDEIAKIKEEKAKLKELAKKEVEVQPVIPEIVKKRVVEGTPVRQRPKEKLNSPRWITC